MCLAVPTTYPVRGIALALPGWDRITCITADPRQAQLPNTIAISKIAGHRPSTVIYSSAAFETSREELAPVKAGLLLSRNALVRTALPTSRPSGLHSLSELPGDPPA
jgi:hypothetical protein